MCKSKDFGKPFLAASRVSTLLTGGQRYRSDIVFALVVITV